MLILKLAQGIILKQIGLNIATNLYDSCFKKDYDIKPIS